MAPNDLGGLGDGHGGAVDVDVAPGVAVLGVGAEDGGRRVHEDLGGPTHDGLELGDGRVTKVLARVILADVEGQVLLPAQLLKGEKGNFNKVSRGIQVNIFGYPMFRDRRFARRGTWGSGGRI